MTPQELIDLPWYGRANKSVKALGMWRDTMTDTERIEWLADNVGSMRRRDDQQSWNFTLDGDSYDSEFLRDDIDEHASAYTQGLYAKYLED